MIKELLTYIGIGFLYILVISFAIASVAVPLLCLASKHWLWAAFSAIPFFLFVCAIIGYNCKNPYNISYGVGF